MCSNASAQCLKRIKESDRKPINSINTKARRQDPRVAMNVIKLNPSTRNNMSIGSMKSRIAVANKSLPDQGTGIKKKSKKKERPRKPKTAFVIPEWDCLPDIILEDIFSRLSIHDRNMASQVCRNWNRIFYSPRIWNTFVLGDYTLTRRKYNYYLGYQHVLDHHRTQICLHRVGRNFRNLVITPMENFLNLYEFMTIATHFSEYFEDEPLNLVKSLDFTFICEIQYARDNKVFGTGGQLLEGLKNLMSSLQGLRHLSLQDLLLEKEEAVGLLDDVAYNCCEALKTLRLINCTKDPYPIFHAGVFINLQKLTISPQHISEDVIQLIGYTNLRELYLLQTKHTDTVTPVAAKAWRDCRKMAPLLNVHLKMEGKFHSEIVWQEGAPVRSVVYDSPYANVSFPSAIACINLFSNDLRVYGHLGIPRFYMPRNYEDRADSSWLLICRTCKYLHTIIIRELVSTTTLLLLAHECKRLQRLLVRQNAILKKFDWPYNPEWSPDFYCWLKKTSKSYELTTQEVSRMMGIRWVPLTDRAFKRVVL